MLTELLPKQVQNTQNTEIKVYTTEICPKCQRLKTFLQAQGIPFQVIDMQSPEGQTELKFNGIFTLEAPVLQIGQKFHLAKQLFKNGNDLSIETKFFISTEAERLEERLGKCIT